MVITNDIDNNNAIIFSDLSNHNNDSNIRSIISVIIVGTILTLTIINITKFEIAIRKIDVLIRNLKVRDLFQIFLNDFSTINEGNN